MNAKLKEMYEAHVAHELDRLGKEGYKQFIADEIAAVFDWIGKVEFQEILPLDQMLGLIQRNVVELPIPGAITELSGEMSRLVHASGQKKKTKLETIFSRRQFDEIVDKAVSLKSARHTLIHNVLHSSLYARLISHVLYKGIRDYLLTENIIVQHVPGISSLIKIGKNAVNQNLPRVEPLFEEHIRRFIEKNIKDSILTSENFVDDLLVEEEIIEIGEEIWDTVSAKPLSDFFNMIDGDDMEDFILLGYDFWHRFRKTAYFKSVYTEIIKNFYEKYGDKTLDIFFEDVGVTREMLVHELTEIASPGIEKAIAIGYVEERIRAHLASFYNSTTAKALIG